MLSRENEIMKLLPCKEAISVYRLQKKSRKIFSGCILVTSLIKTHCVSGFCNNGSVFQIFVDNFLVITLSKQAHAFEHNSEFVILYFFLKLDTTIGSWSCLFPDPHSSKSMGEGVPRLEAVWGHGRQEFYRGNGVFFL